MILCCCRPLQLFIFAYIFLLACTIQLYKLRICNFSRDQDHAPFSIFKFAYVLIYLLARLCVGKPQLFWRGATYDQAVAPPLSYYRARTPGVDIVSPLAI
jgi:hypothetical protein